MERREEEVEEEEEEYTDEQIEAISKEIMECDYYPKDITQKDMEDYMKKEENAETVKPQDFDKGDPHSAMNVAEQFLVKDIENRINRKYRELGIQPNPEIMNDDINEEIRLFRIRQWTNVVREWKAEYQVQKIALVNTFRDEEVLKTYSGKEIQDYVLTLHHTKKTIESMEEELKGWEQEVRQRYHQGEEGEEEK